MFKRVLKTLSALGLGQFIMVATQLLLPPAFLSAYGMQNYGEWLVLSAAIGYLGTLDFGLQTYVINELTVLFHRGDMTQFHRVQSVGLRLTLGLTAMGTLLASLAFLLPVEQWLKISLSHVQTSWTLFLLALQLFAGIVMGNVNGLFRVFGKAHRGAMWGNGYRLLLLAATLGPVAWGATFEQIALAQLVVLLGSMGIILLDLKRTAPDVFPSLRYWDRALAGKLLKPSLFFSCFTVNNFLLYQAPVLLLQRFFGPQSVVIFTVARSLFSFVRQGVTLIQHSLAPEITRLYGLGEKARLARVFVLNESVVMSLSLVANVGMLLLSPYALKLWLGRPELFDFKIYLLLMLITTVMNLKECKLYLQFSTNNHVRTGVLSTLSYLGMLGACCVLLPKFGPLSVLAVWLLTESLLVVSLHIFNARLLADETKLTFQPLIKLSLMLVVISVGLLLTRSWLARDAGLTRGFGALAAMVVIAAGCYLVFNLGNFICEWKTQWRRNFWVTSNPVPKRTS